MRYRSPRIVPGTNLPSSIDSNEIDPERRREDLWLVESRVVLPGISTNRRVWSSVSSKGSETMTVMPQAGHEVAASGISFEQAEQRTIGGGLYHAFFWSAVTCHRLGKLTGWEGGKRSDDPAPAKRAVAREMNQAGEEGGDG
jgi:hypothetical protein